uniref:Mitochondrial import inner membrane translocase subunit Tim21 n=1 Tax=Rhabditophanes sp. KR3021 TaxID=114890 RepID=A0AC35UFG8_9BILA
MQLRARFPIYAKVLVKPNICIRPVSSTPTVLKEIQTKSQRDKDQHALQKSVLEDIFTEHKEAPKTFAGKAKEATVNSFWYACLAASVAGLIGLIYTVGKEFFGNDSPQVVFSKSLKMVKDHEEVIRIFGEGIAGFGEENSRGRRKALKSQKYEQDGQERLRLEYHIKGAIRRGTVTVDMGNDAGTWDYRYIVVKTDSRPIETIMVVDNRGPRKFLI